jgi:hypothetical protein
MDADPKYEGVTFVVNNEEPCGFVACDHVATTTYDEERAQFIYHVERLGLDGAVIKRITLDEEDIDEGLAAHDFPMHADKHSALDFARGAVPEPDDV